MHTVITQRGQPETTQGYIHMSFKNKKVASEAGRKVGIRRTEKAIGRLIRKAKSGEKITMQDSKNYAKFMMNVYGLEMPIDFFYNKHN